MTDRRSAADAHARLDTHEAECAIRYEALHGAISELKGGMKWAIGLAFSILLTISGYLAVQVVESRPPAVVTVAAP